MSCHSTVSCCPTICPQATFFIINGSNCIGGWGFRQIHHYTPFICDDLCFEKKKCEDWREKEKCCRKRVRHFINICNDRFDPCEINIRVGDRVIWINDSHCNQTIISDNHRCDIGPWDFDQTLCPRERLELKFRKPGRWIYRSRHHRHFVGIINVCY